MPKQQQDQIYLSQSDNILGLLCVYDDPINLYKDGYADIPVYEESYINFFNEIFRNKNVDAPFRAIFKPNLDWDQKNFRAQYAKIVDWVYDAEKQEGYLKIKVLGYGTINSFDVQMIPSDLKLVLQEQFGNLSNKINLQELMMVFFALEKNNLDDELASQENEYATFLKFVEESIGSTKDQTLINEINSIFFRYNPQKERNWSFDDLKTSLIKYDSLIAMDKERFDKELVMTLINSVNPLILNKNKFTNEAPTKINILEVLTEISAFISNYIQTEFQITKNMNNKLNEQQKEFLLREKIKIIQSMLEEMNAPVVEDDYAKLIKDDKLKNIYPKTVRDVIASESKRITEMMQASPEATLAKTYIETLKKLPWRITQTEHLDIEHAREVLDSNHYGLDNVKERVLEYLAVIINKKLKTQKEEKEAKLPYKDDLEIDLNLFKEEKEAKKSFNNVPIITLVGPPGVGKTSLSKAIADALNRKFIKVSLGGVHDESEIRGHRRTYVGAMPGKIIKGINQVGVSNPVILLDEIDKMKSDMKGDPASAMLEVLDPEQNTHFQDHYLEHEYDLSKAIFIATANYYEAIPAPLLDRVEVIELSSYTLSEKINIARNHLLPKVLEQASLEPQFLEISDQLIEFIIKHYTKEAGVRGLKRLLDKIARKIVMKKMEHPKMRKYKLVKADVLEFLGVIKFKQEEKDIIDVPGIVNGLAYTSFGGSSLQIEVNVFKGKPEIKLTGSLKDVMKESAQIALSYVRANAQTFGIEEFDFETHTIHIHVPEGAVPKDGPSAGVTFTTALISALRNQRVPSDIGMTGEITLRGKVLEIGGLKEKSFAANQKGLTRVFIPASNEKNLQDIPDEIKSTISYIPVHDYKEIFDVIFANKQPKKVVVYKSEDKNEK